ncbi:hypothetical protein [Nocardioides albus]|uniref:Uncharacterized protein n=1 Tax=Nocardioides albus TaxID=1841 RepID=A0A7W5A1K7_9ACTN|nr:hypothetical protein [Nocardioides albus]MBB3087977.1 hypothetical protein [Nocardioides albus]GGU21726.1 hypothetical protein GCM10007979_20460 [Nocardioides albus]
MTLPPYGIPPDAVPLYELLCRSTEGSPYIVEPTAKGFDFKVDIANAQWWDLLGRSGLTKSYVHHITVTDSGTYSITDDLCTISWNVGVPTAHYTYKRTYGRNISIGFGKAYALDDDLIPAEVYSYTYSTEESRRVIQSAARSLGMKEEWPAAAIVGLVFAIIGSLGAVAALITVGILRLAS